MAQATARHILVSTEEKCNELKTEIENGADFAQVAKENSSCPSSRDGGNLGTFGPGPMVKEFDTVVFSAPINVVKGPVKTQFGYHLLEVTSRQDCLIQCAHALDQAFAEHGIRKGLGSTTGFRYERNKVEL